MMSEQNEQPPKTPDLGLGRVIEGSHPSIY